MKFSQLKNGHLGLLLSLSVLVSCNPSEYYPTEELIAGADAYCSQGKDVYSCQALGDICQPAYEPLEIETAEPVFSACVANPEMWDPNYGDPSGTGSTGTTTDPNSGSTTSPDGSTSGSTDGSTDGSTGGSTDGSTGGSTDGSTDGSSGTAAPAPQRPTMQEAFASKCENLEPQYMWDRKEVQKKKGVISHVRKVKVCHTTGNLSQHTILIACPALKAHMKHQDDYIGACQF